MEANKVKNIIKDNTMLIALIAITLFLNCYRGYIACTTKYYKFNFSNGYVVILAVGMLMCILTGVTSTFSRFYCCAC